MVQITEGKVWQDYNRIKKLAHSYIKRNKYEKALCMLNLASHIMTGYQFIFADEDIEDMIGEVSKGIHGESTEYEARKNTVLLYDYQGLENRGLVWIYVRALLNLGFHLIYLTYEQSSLDISNLEREIVEGGGIVELVEEGKNLEREADIYETVLKYRPDFIFIHTIPCDIAAMTAFRNLDKNGGRIMISLEDHGFCIGKNSIDKVIEFRDYGYLLAKEERRIPEKKLFLLPFYPIVYRKDFEGYDFETRGKKVIFSGGSLYKTEGSNCYYEIVRYILDIDPDTIFVYAGNGENRQMEKLRKDYTERVHQIAERKDLYGVMDQCYFYLSTYPIVGGLMAQYAAAAGRIPITLQLENQPALDVMSFLSNGTGENIAYSSIEDIKAEIKKLISDPVYKKEKEERLTAGIMEEKWFTKELSKILKGESTSIKHRNITLNLDGFKKTYLNAATWKKYCRYYFNRNRREFVIIRHFPMKCLCSILYKFKR